ncbi:DUF998 domain-containing protein [Amycolatopsis anabasis]|uniref:DUF998 domain-containing protein n=1 Tax=Amycolatopsis anabasis TaxID=1840409 RepID=UPI00131C54AD|nr:DUF998 domain-containing protein [Amycolatopsis anabasis]
MFNDHERWSTRVLLSCGIAGPALFLLLFHLDAVTRAGYDLWRHGPSLMMTGDRGWFQVANFVVTGVLMLACAVGLRRAVRTGRGSVWGPPLVAVYGVGMICTGWFRTDPEEGYPPGTPWDRLPGGNYLSSWQHGAHTLSVLVMFTAATVACFVFARRFAAEPGGRPWAVGLVGTGVMAPLILGSGIVISDEPDLALLDGVFGRLIIPLGLVWAALVPLRLATRTATRTAGTVSS